MAHVCPTTLIGTSGQGGAFTRQIVAPWPGRPHARSFCPVQPYRQYRGPAR
ncbi:hypothetical protein RAA17_11500 [Komagataeibacter rhaeticus]|nr:hypothetical protein [Komagataeibacter rhaeticus]